MKKSSPAARSRLAHLTSLTTCLLCVALFMSACTTTQFGPSLNPLSVVRPGDTVRCTLKDGSRRVFKVVTVAPGEIRGESEKVLVSEIARLEAKRFSPLKTVALSAGVFTLVFLAGTAATIGPGLPAFPAP